MSILKKIKNTLKSTATKVVVASMIGISTIFGMAPTAHAKIVEPPRIEMHEEQVYKGKVYDGKPIEIVVVDSEEDIPVEARENRTQKTVSESKEKEESTWDTVKGWLKDHPIKEADKKMNEIKQRVNEEMNEYNNKTKQIIEDTIDNKISSYKAEVLKDIIETISTMFEFVVNSLIILPIDLVTNQALRSLYFKLLVVSISLIAVFALYNCLVSMFDDSNYIGFSFMVGRVFKAIFFMMSSTIYIPVLVMFTNRMAEGILSLTMEQVQMNIFIDMIKNGSLISISGTVGAIIMSIMILVFLFQIFLHTCCRYWEICKIFAMAPLAFAMSVIPSEDHIYISWRNKLKHILFVQILYALHISIFVAIMSVPFDSAIISLMIFIGGIWDLTKLPTGLNDLFRSDSANKTLGFGKHLVSSLVAKKIPVAKVAEKIKK